MRNLEESGWSLGQAGEIGLRLKCGEGEAELLEPSGNARGCTCDFVEKE